MAGGLNIGGYRLGKTLFPYVGAAAGFTGLLDTYGGAAAAYSLRKLSSTYSGSAVRVRESGGNTEADIGFNADGTLDTTALLAHCGANDGFVRTWYDQSGNARDAGQATTTDQPQIVGSGLVLLQNTKPAIRFDGANHYFNVGNISSIGSAGTVFNVIKADGASATQGLYHLGSATASSHYPFSDGNIYDGFGSTARKSTGSPISSITDQSLYTCLSKASEWTSWLDGAQNYTTATNTVGFTTTAKIGESDSATAWFNGDWQEIILYGSDQSANRTAIESNIADYYGITLP